MWLLEEADEGDATPVESEPKPDKEPLPEDPGAGSAKPDVKGVGRDRPADGAAPANRSGDADDRPEGDPPP